MDISQHVVGQFTNDTTGELRIFLEMTCEEVYLAPGHMIELLAKSSPGLLPITVSYTPNGLQIFAHMDADPEWIIRFEGKLIQPGYPTLLSGILTAMGPSKSSGT